jgi:serine/threonine protein kinase/Tol biopolymer transport system component
MDRERWQQIDLIFETALARPADERAQFLDEACAGDAELRAQVESLIAHEQAEGFLEGPAFHDAARVLAEDARHLLVGQSISSYQILSRLGVGGMGEVYLALHSRTNRKVALKLLPAVFMKDQQRVQRFQQEARTVLALNHPNIVTVYDIEQAGETPLIATEVIEGETLRQRLSHARLKLTEVLDVAIQVAGALAAAHGAGVVHRDIKPENIMLRPDGFVKVLDFGLAKLTEREPVAASSEFPTRAMINTDVGMVMGTANYMSPEQARGLEVDARTDIFSFGVVFYEMLTGNLPFAGETKSDVMAAILQNEPPPLARYWPEASDALEWIVTKTLTKERDERYQTAKELLTDLKRLKRRSDYQVEAARFASTPSGDSASVAQSTEETANKTAAPPVVSTAETTRTMSSAEYVVNEIKRHKRSIIFAVGGIAVLAVIIVTGVILGLRYLRRAPLATGSTAQPFAKMKVTRLTNTGNASHAAISPDGKYVVHVTGGIGQQSLQLRHIATGSDKEIVPPSKEHFAALTFSRDGSYIYYIKYSDKEGGVLSQVPVLGGTPRVLGKDVDGAPTFSPDGKQFAFIRGLPVENKAALLIASVDGGGERTLVTKEARHLFAPASINAWGPAWSPDGELIAFALRSSEANGTQYGRVMLVRLKDGTQMPLTSDKWASIGQIAWLPNGSGMIITAAEQEPGAPHQLWYVSYPNGTARRLTNDLNNYDGVKLTGEATALATVQSERRANIWVAANGEASRAAQIPSDRNDALYGMSWTPDRRILFTSTSGGNRDIWIMDADGSNRKALTLNDSADSAPTVSSDGRYIIFVSNRGGASHIWRMEADGGNPKQLTNGSSDSRPSCSPDNQWVIYSADDSGKRSLWKVPIDGGSPVQVTDYFTGVPVVSPDGKFIACAYIDERMTPRRYVTAVIPITGGRPLKEFEFPRPFQQVVRWTPDSRTLTYLVTSGGVSNIWRQPLDGGKPEPLTDFQTDMIFQYDWSRDGKQLALARGTVTSDVVLITDFK